MSLIKFDLASFSSASTPIALRIDRDRTKMRIDNFIRMMLKVWLTKISDAIPTLWQTDRQGHATKAASPKINHPFNFITD